MKNVLISILALILSYNSLAKDNSVVFDRAKAAFPNNGRWVGTGSNQLACKIDIDDHWGSIDDGNLTIRISGQHRTKERTVEWDGFFTMQILQTTPDYVNSSFDQVTGNSVRFIENNRQIGSSTILTKTVANGKMTISYRYSYRGNPANNFSCSVSWP